MALDKSNIVKINIRDHEIKQATKVISERPIYDHSYRKLAGNQVGFLGEIIVKNFLNDHNVNFKEYFNTKFDLILDDGKTIEIKTKDRTVSPDLDYDCSLPLYNHEHQSADYYFFVSLLRDKFHGLNELSRFHSAFILGFSTNKQIHKLGIVWRKGQVDPSNKTKFWTDCINIKIKDLYSIGSFVRKYGKKI